MCVCVWGGRAMWNWKQILPCAADIKQQQLTHWWLCLLSSDEQSIGDVWPPAIWGLLSIFCPGCNGGGMVHYEMATQPTKRSPPTGCPPQGK